MAIHSSTVAEHRFTVTRRRGYVISEVDAVMARILETLREHETLIAQLEARVEDAEASTGALEKDRMDLLRAGDDLVSFAEEEAERILSDARRRAAREMSRREQQVERVLADGMRKADSIAAEGRRRHDEAIAEAERIAAQAEARRDEALAYLLRMRRKAAEEATRIIRGTLVEVQRLRSATRAEISSARMRAETESIHVLAGAREEADGLVKEAHAERIALNQRIAQLHSALADLEDELQDPATTALMLRQATMSRAPSSTVASGGASRISDRFGPGLAGITREAITIHLEEEAKAAPGGPTELAAAVRQILQGPDPDDAEQLPGRPQLDTSTWYQRHGGGIRRRMDEQREDPPE
jgi:DivIVA domain-containing protein